MQLKLLILTALSSYLSLARADALISANNVDGAGGVALAFRKEADGVALEDRKWASTLSWGPVPTDRDTAPGRFIVKTADEAARVSDVPPFKHCASSIVRDAMTARLSSSSCDHIGAPDKGTPWRQRIRKLTLTSVRSTAAGVVPVVKHKTSVSSLSRSTGAARVLTSSRWTSADAMAITGSLAISSVRDRWWTATLAPSTTNNPSVRRFLHGNRSKESDHRHDQSSCIELHCCNAGLSRATRVGPQETGRASVLPYFSTLSNPPTPKASPPISPPAPPKPP
jgi:hypothetical protein